MGKTIRGTVTIEEGEGQAGSPGASRGHERRSCVRACMCACACAAPVVWWGWRGAAAAGAAPARCLVPAGTLPALTGSVREVSAWSGPGVALEPGAGRLEPCLGCSGIRVASPPGAARTSLLSPTHLPLSSLTRNQPTMV